MFSNRKILKIPIIQLSFIELYTEADEKSKEELESFLFTAIPDELSYTVGKP